MKQIANAYSLHEHSYLFNKLKVFVGMGQIKIILIFSFVLLFSFSILVEKLCF